MSNKSEKKEKNSSANSIKQSKLNSSLITSKEDQRSSTQIADITQVKFLGQQFIQLIQNRDTPNSLDLPVPPTSPRHLIPDLTVTPVPNILPPLTNVPWVREIGVKETIRRLSDVYQCKQFNWNLIQFWFLDFVTDCLWRVQDEYQFPEERQKIVLEWVLFAFNLIRAPNLNLSRKQVFKIFNEAIIEAEHHIETGASSIPSPEELFALKVEEQEEPQSTMTPPSSTECSAVPSVDENEPTGKESYLAIKLSDGIKFFDLPPKMCPWDSDEECMSSSIETTSEDEVIIVKEETEKNSAEEELQNPDLMYEDFYKPDLATPPRFKPSIESMLEDSISLSFSEESYNVEIEEEEEKIENPPNWFVAKRKFPNVPCPSKTFEVQSDESSEYDEKKKEEEVLQSWFDYHLWQLRKADMDDSATGWIGPSNIDLESIEQVAEYKKSESEEAQNQLFQYVTNVKDQIKEMKHNQFMNTCMIMAIKQIVHEYFFDNFQFSLLRMAYRYPQYLITQELNKEWCVPKIIKGDIKRPMPKRKKKEKKKKDRKKKGSKKSKNSKKSSKTSKKSKSSKGKGSEKSKKSKKSSQKVKEKKKELTKKEKAEMAQLEAEMNLREEMEKRAEENRNYMFPLTDAAEDSFFESVFLNWSKAKKKGGKVDKKGDKGKKKSKKGSEKSSKKSKKIK